MTKDKNGETEDPKIPLTPDFIEFYLTKMLDIPV